MMDSDIGNIAKEVASSINIEVFGDVNENTNPMELFSTSRLIKWKLFLKI